jgi:hypothetical protein
LGLDAYLTNDSVNYRYPGEIGAYPLFFEGKTWRATGDFDKSPPKDAATLRLVTAMLGLGRGVDAGD